MKYILSCVWALLCCHVSIVAPFPGHILATKTPTAISHQSFTRVVKKPSQLPLLESPTLLAPLTSYAPPPSGPEDGDIGDYFRHAEKTGDIGGQQDDRVEVQHHSSSEVVQFELIAAAAAGTADVGPTPILQSERHTPAHLTYAASPIVYKMLPVIKPVRSIAYKELQQSLLH